jgi:pimeloyl-ACP methyl ester carboxylesterase
MAKTMLVAAFLQLLSTAAAEDDTSSRCTAATFKHPDIPGARVISITAEEKHNITTRSVFDDFDTATGISYCDVKLHLTHPGADDDVLVQTWLPLNKDDWNGRYQATGGGGWATGFFEPFLGPALKAGYAASSTDGGHQENAMDVSWALNPDRSVNWKLLQNFATRSLADQILVGKALTEQYFGTPPHHSYWNGCSQGGRQGYVVAQKYPGLLDGIYAVAPAVDFVNINMGNFWPQLAMNEAATLMSPCEFSYFLAKTVEECDILDGVRDGIIEDPEACTFDPNTLIGHRIECNGKEIDITPAMAEVVRKIREGPRTPSGEKIWHGYPHGTPMGAVADIEINAEGIRSLSPMGFVDSFLRHLLIKEPSFNISKLAYADYVAMWAQANEQYGWMLNGANPDLEAFRNAGGKILTWHGINDQIIPYQNTIQYRKRVEAEMGGTKAVNDFYRVFLAPGVLHCGDGPGPIPKDPLEVLVEWVEKGEPPERLEAETENERGERVTRELCPYPKQTKYMGIGDGLRASSWTCEGGEDEEEEESQLENTADFVGGLKDRLMQLGVDMGLSIG